MTPKLPALTVVMLLVTACASPGIKPISEVRPVMGREIVITAAQILESPSINAWDVVQSRAPQFTAFATRVTSGPNSLSNGGSPLLVVDGSRTSDLRNLVEIPANWIAVIRILNGADASTYYGPAAAAGAIVVELKR